MILRGSLLVALISLISCQSPSNTTPTTISVSESPAEKTEEAIQTTNKVSEVISQPTEKADNNTSPKEIPAPESQPVIKETPAPTNDADIIVVGAGPAGLAAAIEAANNNATVLVIERNSVAGGHGVMAGGFAMVNTELQQRRKITDSPELAYKDWMAYGETNNQGWTKRYAEDSAEMIYDWLTSMGVVFRIIIPTPENSVPRFHFTKGTSINVVVPMMRRAFSNGNIRFLMTHEARDLITDNGKVVGIKAKNLRSQSINSYYASQVIVATGGFQGSIEKVLRYWNKDLQQPEELLIGGSRFATGSGHELAGKAGAAATDIEQQVVYLNAIANPREPERAIKFSNPQAIWINVQGKRFVNERGSDKQTVSALLRQEGGRYWAVFDEKAKRRISFRDAPWLNKDTIEKEILSNPNILISANSVFDLAAKLGISESNLEQTVLDYNQAVYKKDDAQFGRFSKDSGRLREKPLTQAPFYAIRLYPMSRKNLGGLSINQSAAVLNTDNTPITGLFAAGEVTGVAGINGSWGMNGTFLGPSVYTGRIAGKNAATRIEQSQALSSSTAQIQKDKSVALFSRVREGYWHFEQVHKLIIERDTPCLACHTESFPMVEAVATSNRQAQLNTCQQCH